MKKIKEIIFISFIIIFGMLSGCSSLPQQSSVSQNVLSEAPNVLNGWIYSNNCFDGSYSLCRFNLDGEVVNLNNNVPETIVIDKNWIYYSIFPDGKDTFEIYKIKPDGTRRKKSLIMLFSVKNFMFMMGGSIINKNIIFPASKED